jgi:hypothetical protein
LTPFRRTALREPKFTCAKAMFSISGRSSRCTAAHTAAASGESSSARISVARKSGDTVVSLLSTRIRSAPSSSASRRPALLPPA